MSSPEVFLCARSDETSFLILLQEFDFANTPFFERGI